MPCAPVRARLALEGGAAHAPVGAVFRGGADAGQRGAHRHRVAQGERRRYARGLPQARPPRPAHTRPWRSLHDK